jgi:hypothetical protein
MTLYSKPRKASWKDDQGILKLLQDFVGKNVTLQEIDRFTVEQFLRRVLARPVTPARVNRYIAVLKSFWYKQIEWGKATLNPLKGIKLYQETVKNEYLEDFTTRAPRALAARTNALTSARALPHARAAPPNVKTTSRAGGQGVGIFPASISIPVRDLMG